MDFLQKLQIKNNFQVARSQLPCVDDDKKANSKQAFISAQKIYHELNEWVNLAAKDENRAEARKRMVFCIKDESSRLDLQGLGLIGLPPNFKGLIEEDLKHLKHLKLDRNILNQLSDDMKSWIKNQAFKISVVWVDTMVKVQLIPSRQDYNEAGLADQLWYSKNKYSLFKQHAVIEVRTYADSQGGIAPRQAIKELYQPEYSSPDGVCRVTTPAL